MKTFGRILKSVLPLGSVALLLLLSAPGAWANGNRALDLVAPYAYFDWAVPPATGPYTTHYLITNPRPGATTVNVKCYDSNGVRMGPLAGTTFVIAPDTIAWADPVSLGLTTTLGFDGFGWCYFAGSDYFAVGFVAGISVGGNLITTNNSRAIISGTAEHMVTTLYASIPYWTKEGSWNTYFLALNPTATSRTLTTNAYSPAGALLGTWIATLSARDMDYGPLADLVGVPAYASWGNADITVSGRGFAGWTAGINFASYQAFFSSVPLSSLWVSELGAGDRP
jgi:hypothetical protein